MATRKTAAKKTTAAPAKKAATPAKKAAAAPEKPSAGLLCSYGDGNAATARGIGNAPVCEKHAAVLRAASYNVNEL